MTKKLIRLGHSPDPDDAFMFYGLASGEVDPGPFRFDHILRDIQTLNDWAVQAKLEVTAISVHAYPYVQEKYAILATGASMGATELATYVGDHPGVTVPLPADPTGPHGPLLVAAEAISLDAIAGKTIAIPGEMTSAYLALQLALGPVNHRVIKFDEILDAIAKGEVDAGVIIHEGQITYQDQGLRCLLDLGQWWFEQTQLPLPLGCNLIRRDLGPEVGSQISGILRDSIEYGLSHRPEAIRYAMKHGRGLDPEKTDRFVGMYVNEWTRGYGPKGRQAVSELLKRACDANLAPATIRLDFV